MWADLGRALALVLVIEGMLPFVSPRTWRKSLLGFASLEDRWMRLIGFGAMFGGILLLNLLSG